jgi:hypothetical protein
MLGIGWLTLRQAQEALQSGRLEEAQRLLSLPETQGHKGSSQLWQQLAQGYTERGRQNLKHDEVEAAWKDLLQAEKTGACDSGAARLRQELTRLGLAEARKLLEAGEPGRAVEALAPLNKGSARQADVQLMEEAAKGWNLARDLAARGEFALAQETVERVRPLLPGPPQALERFRNDLHERGRTFAALLVQLHEAADHQQWREVVQLSEQVLAQAPQHAEARKARSRAWRAIEPVAATRARTAEEPDVRKRFLLWVDGVGGYLVCLATRVTLGQAAPDAYVDVPLFADVSRTHAALTRDPEGYLLEALRPIQVNGRPTEKALLQPGDQITLGTRCQFQFRQPVPVSATARLDLTSGHRLPLAVDGVLLMADTLVLGPNSHAHVTIGHLEQPVVLFRQKDGLGIRYTGSFTVDGLPCRERATIGSSARVTGDEFSFAVEPVGARMGSA